MPLIDSRPLRGWRFLLLNIVLSLGNVLVLSNVPGYTVLSPYAAGNLQGVTPSFGTWATTDHMMGIALGFVIARWLAARFGDYRVLVAAYVFYAAMSLSCAMSDTIYFFVASRILLGPRRRRHNPCRAIRAARRISGEPENVRRRALGRAQHDAIHGRHLSRRLVFGISRLALPVLLQHSRHVAGRRRRGFVALWPWVSTALPAFRLRWFFLARGDSF